jgi:hypothetical protein
VRIELADPLWFAGKEAELRPPTILEFDIIRQIAKDDPVAETLVKSADWIVYVSVIFVVLALIYFTYLSGGE